MRLTGMRPRGRANPDGAILFTGPLVDDLRRLDLTRLDFDEIWDSAQA